MSNFTKNEAIPLSNGTYNAFSFTSSCSSFSLAEENSDSEFKSEIEAIEASYHAQLQELHRWKLSHLDLIRKRWMAKKKMSVH